MRQSKKPFVLQVSAGATRGGASGVVLSLLQSLANQGYPSKFATSCKYENQKDFLHIPKNTHSDAKNIWEKMCFSMCKQTKKLIGKVKGAGFTTNMFYNFGRPSCLIKNLRGIENFENYPGTTTFFESLKPFPEIIHCHNLHGRFFDLRILPKLSKKVPVVITLHDEWMFTGHCACTFGCNKWKTGCGNCQNLTSYDALWRDTTAYNLKQKYNIYKQCNLHVITPSKWLMKKAKQSILAPGIKTSKVIHNGVDLALFKPGNKKSVRDVLSLPHDTHIALFAAAQAKTLPIKDYNTLEKALFWIEQHEQIKKKILLLCVGERSKRIIRNNIEIQFIDYISDKVKLVLFYQAADFFIHATKTDNFPMAILEALACGLPVIGTNVGGIPEQIEPHKTGMLYQAGNHLDLAEKILFLLKNKTLLSSMSQQARHIAKTKFSLEKMITQHIDYYTQALRRHFI